MEDLRTVIFIKILHELESLRYSNLATSNDTVSTSDIQLHLWSVFGR